MDISSVNSDLIRGNVTTIILGCLKNEDRYGYEILKEIEDKSNSQYVLKQATLYNQLKRLEKQGLVSSYDGNPDDTGGGKRRYYSLTKEGHAYLEKEKSEYEYSRTILDKLVSDDEFDFRKQIPFDASELRPYSKRDPEEKPKVVYKDKLVEKLVEKKVFLDKYGNEITAEEAEQLRLQAEEEAQQTKEKLSQMELEALETSQQLRIKEEEAQKAVEQLRLKEEEALKQQEELLKTQELAQRHQEQLMQSEQTALENEEKLRQTEEQLRKAEEDKELVKAMLRKMEEDKLREEEIKRAEAEAERKRLEEERILVEQEAERKRQEQAKPAQTLEEMFAKLDAESEYKQQQAREQEKVEFKHVEPEEHTYINGYTNQVEHVSRSQTSLKDIFRQLDEREAEIDREKEEEAKAFAEYEAQKEQEKQEQWAMANAMHQQELDAMQEQVPQPAPSQPTNDGYYPAELETQNRNYSPQEDKGAFVTSAVINRQEGGFDYEKDDVNYRDFFVSLQEQNARITDEEKPKQQSFDYQDSDIKTRLYAKGYKIRPYDRGNTSEYYTFNFIQSNRINRDTFLIILAFFVAEIAIMWASLATRISYVYFLPITLVGCALCLVPTVVYLMNPTKRIRANFNFKLSILNRTMLFIELSVVCILIGFFALGANVNDMDLILQSIILPMVLLTNLPLSSLIYWLLYRTRKYHTA